VALAPYWMALCIVAAAKDHGMVKGREKSLMKACRGVVMAEALDWGWR